MMTHDVVVVADAAGVIRFWSEGAARAFGYPVSQAIGQTLDLLVPHEFREAHWKGFHRAMASGSAAAEGQPGPFPVLHANGQTLTAQGRLSLLRGPGGAAVAAAVVYDAP